MNKAQSFKVGDKVSFLAYERGYSDGRIVVYQNRKRFVGIVTSIFASQFAGCDTVTVSVSDTDELNDGMMTVGSISSKMKRV